jgi:pilus assembly protein Flp/PilA
MRLLRRLWRCRSGATAAEYALILALVGTAIAGAALYLGGTLSGEINQSAGLLTD